MSTVLRAAWLFDGAADTLMPDPVVILDGGTITAAGTALPVPAGATVVDLGDATILPGLVDTHVHLAFDASTDPVGHLAARDDAEALTAMTAAAAAGVAAVWLSLRAGRGRARRWPLGSGPAGPGG